MTAFTADRISDQKRVTRAEQWIVARRILRARDHAHRSKWRVMLVAGPNPAEEIKCVRTALPSSIIHAVDIEPTHVALAKMAEADFAVVSDLRDFSHRPAVSGAGNMKVPHERISLGNEFDVICLDMTCSAGIELQQMLEIYWNGLSKGGALIITFSYGRDVREVYSENWAKYQAPGRQTEESKYIAELDLPQVVSERVFWLLGKRAKYLRSIIQYRGAEMPMLSCAIVKTREACFAKDIFIAIEDGDFEAAVTADDIGDIYACPRDRVLALRRSAAARKAVATRKLRESA